jgi:hypothetical protein
MANGKKGPGPAPEIPARTMTFKALGVECPLPGWALAPLALIVVLALAAYLAQQFVLPLLTRLKDLDAYEAEKNEAYKHSLEQPLALAANGPELRINYFKSDGCLQVVRGGTQAQWLVSPPLVHRDPAPGRLAERPAIGALPWETPAEAQPPAAGPVPVPRNCLSPHPGTFTQSTGGRRGCWQQELRRWPDGCQHYQWFDACHRTWDVNPDGSARVYWTVCKH